MVNQLNRAIDDVINCIVESFEYRKCMAIKEQMMNNSSLMELINNIKKLQKKYVATNDEKVLSILNENIEKLNTIPIYVVYMQYLEKVNEMINLVKDELNDYFVDILNN